MKGKEKNMEAVGYRLKIFLNNGESNGKANGGAYLAGCFTGMQVKDKKDT